MDNNELRTEQEIINSWSRTDSIIVSILCLCFNQEDYIETAIKSFLRQITDFKFEIVIHDDASSDLSVSIINKYKEKYPNIIKTFFQSSNKFSLNSCNIFKIPFGYCKGEYIAICEGDDFWNSENKLAVQEFYMRNNNNVQMTFHQSNVIGLNGKLNFVSNDGFLDEMKITTVEIINSWFIYTQTIMFRNNITSGDLDYFDNVVNLDWALQLICSLKGDVVFLANLKSSYRKHQDGFSNTALKDLDFRAEKLFLLIESFDRYSKYKFKNEAYSRKVDVLNEYFELRFKNKYGKILFFVLNPKAALLKGLTFFKKLNKLNG